jgi:YHS domain-containing protein/uncharacterized membrane protein YraQ (UPF0718 family)
MGEVITTVGRSLAEGWWMFYDTLWALVLGFGLSGAVQAFVSKGEMQRVLGDHRPATVAKSSFFGMVSSSCSYAASALAKSLFARGADFTSSMIFMFASTNLVVELGIVLWLLIGWQFAVAEFIGGAIMIAILAVVLPRVVDVAELDAARARLREGNAGSGGHEAHAAMSEQEHTAKPWRQRIRSKAGWADASGYTISDVTMLRKELVIGFVVAGFASMAVPTSVWRALFLTGHGFWSALENVIVGPFLAFISFVCSVGNVPLAAALWKGGISFGGVIAFVFADLLALPLVLIYRKFYGTRLAVKLSLVFWAVMSIAGLITEGIFSLAGLVPTKLRGDIAIIHFGLNYTTVLNVIAVIAFGYLYWLYKNASRFGGGQGYAKDVVCGMQVRTSDAPARAQHQGQTFYFCSDKCHHKFEGAPDKYAGGQAVEAMSAVERQQPGGQTTSATDPVCGMTVNPATAGTADYAGRGYYFCSDGCRSTFLADPLSHLTVARDPVCGMDVTVASPGATATVDGTRYVFCMQGCAEAFTADPGRYLSAAAGASR